MQAPWLVIRSWVSSETNWATFWGNNQFDPFMKPVQFILNKRWRGALLWTVSKLKDFTSNSRCDSSLNTSPSTKEFINYIQKIITDILVVVDIKIYLRIIIHFVKYPNGWLHWIMFLGCKHSGMKCHETYSLFWNDSVKKKERDVIERWKKWIGQNIRSCNQYGSIWVLVVSNLLLFCILENSYNKL